MRVVDEQPHARDHQEGGRERERPRPPPLHPRRRERSNHEDESKHVGERDHRREVHADVREAVDEYEAAAQADQEGAPTKQLPDHGIDGEQQQRDRKRDCKLGTNDEDRPTIAPDAARPMPMRALRMAGVTATPLLPGAAARYSPEWPKTDGLKASSPRPTTEDIAEDPAANRGLPIR